MDIAMSIWIGWWLGLGWALIALGAYNWLRSRREPRRAGSQGRRESEHGKSAWTKSKLCNYHELAQYVDILVRDLNEESTKGLQAGCPKCQKYLSAGPSAGSEQATAPTGDGQSGRSTSSKMSFRVRADGKVIHQGVYWDWPSLIQLLG